MGRGGKNERMVVDRGTTCGGKQGWKENGTCFIPMPQSQGEPPSLYTDTTRLAQCSLDCDTFYPNQSWRWGNGLSFQCYDWDTSPWTCPPTGRLYMLWS